MATLVDVFKYFLKMPCVYYLHVLVIDKNTKTNRNFSCDPGTGGGGRRGGRKAAAAKGALQACSDLLLEGDDYNSHTYRE